MRPKKSRNRDEADDDDGDASQSSHPTRPPAGRGGDDAAYGPSPFDTNNAGGEVADDLQDYEEMECTTEQDAAAGEAADGGNA